ncbi:PilZ domain-containing protein [Sphingomonas sp.]|jgi:hypothetical protein|uniref:PilZ domain-containing protein n=1 Tax=Sphingomonas sp. TaxID=28214 RepID=UPI002EDB2256
MDRINRDRPASDVGVGPTGDGAVGAQPRKRDSLFLLAQIRIDDSDRWADVRVRNLSPGGLMAELEKPLAVGTVVELELRGIGAVTGRIAWHTEGRAGIAFEDAIDPLKARKPVGTGKGDPPYAKAFSPGRPRL